jgi:hypothetical protein
MSAFVLARVGQDGLGRLEIRVQIAENGKAHNGRGILVRYPLIGGNVQLNF